MIPNIMACKLFKIKQCTFETHVIRFIWIWLFYLKQQFSCMPRLTIWYVSFHLYQISLWGMQAMLEIRELTVFTSCCIENTNSFWLYQNNASLSMEIFLLLHMNWFTLLLDLQKIHYFANHISMQCRWILLYNRWYCCFVQYIASRSNLKI